MPHVEQSTTNLVGGTSHGSPERNGSYIGAHTINVSGDGPNIGLSIGGPIRCSDGIIVSGCHPGDDSIDRTSDGDDDLRGISIIVKRLRASHRRSSINQEI